MRATSISKLLTLLLALALALPARADDEEVITDELPDWARAELEDARAWELQVAGMAPNYGADIPSPEEVVYGRAPAAPAAAPVQAQVSEPENLTFDDFREGLAPHTAWSSSPPGAPRSRVGGPTSMGSGSGRNTAGPGFPTSPSAGPPTTTGGGAIRSVSAGSGCRATSGPPPGWRGGMVPTRSAGRLSTRATCG